MDYRVKEKINLIKDVYFQEDYISLYLKKNESISKFEYIEGVNVFYNIAVKKPINKIGNTALKDDFFDLETAYGYGGQYCNTNDSGFIQRAHSKFELFCKENNIIAEFSRIHPFNYTHTYIQDYYDLLILDRKTVSVNTELSTEKRWENYPSKLRTIIRKCKKELVFRKSDNLDDFIHLYEQTMQKIMLVTFIILISLILKHY